jgi:CRISPR-associated protein Cmr5
LTWLKSDYAKNFTDFSKAKSAVELAYTLTTLESTNYRAVTIEVLAYLNWLKRFSTGLKKDENENGKNQN